MINRRILIFGIIAILGITIIKLGTDLVKDNIGSRDDEIELIRSDDGEIAVIDEEGMRKTVFYFKNSEGFLVPVMKQIPWEEGIARVTLSNMVDTAELRSSLADIGLSPVIPAGTTVKGISINEETGLCKVDFSEEIRNIESLKDEENLIKGIVYTLTEFPAIKEVQIMVNGEIVPSLKHDIAINNPIGREDINLMGNAEGGSSKIVVYYRDKSNEEFEYFIPVTIPTHAPMPNVYTALELLFEGPPADSGLQSAIPSDIGWEAIEIREGTAFIDINIKDKADISESELNGMMKNIGLTLSEFEEIQTVELLIDGKVVNTSVPAFANEY